MTPLNRKQKILVTLGIFLLVTIAGAFFVILPWWEESATNKLSAAEDRTALDALTAQEQAFQQAIAKTKKIGDDLALLSTAVVTPSDALPFVIATETVAKKHDVIPTLILGSEQESVTKKEEEQTNDTLKNLPALHGELVLEGTFANLLACIADFQSITPLAEIRSIEITSGGASTKPRGLQDASSTPAGDILHARMALRIFSE